jgi:hypothetical protein
MDREGVPRWSSAGGGPVRSIGCLSGVAAVNFGSVGYARVPLTGGGREVGVLGVHVKLVTRGAGARRPGLRDLPVRVSVVKAEPPPWCASLSWQSSAERAAAAAVGWLGRRRSRGPARQAGGPGGAEGVGQEARRS